MPANVETMMYAGATPWHGLGRNVAKAVNSKEALEAAELDWLVKSHPVQYGGITIPGYRVNVREKDNRPLGIVGDRYQILQNHEAFSFTDALVGEGCLYGTAGSLDDGRRVWMLATLPDTFTFLGDKVMPYLLFFNSHDGSGAVRVCATPVRVVCQNTLNLALSQSQRTWSARHTKSVKDKVEEAMLTLGMARTYLQGMAGEADKLATTPVTPDQWSKIVGKLIGGKEDASKGILERAKARQDNLFDCIMAPDLENFRTGKDMFSAWGVVNAVSDFVTHSRPARLTENYQENMFYKVANGHDWMDVAYGMVSELVSA